MWVFQIYYDSLSAALTDSSQLIRYTPHKRSIESLRHFRSKECRIEVKARYTAASDLMDTSVGGKHAPRQENPPREKREFSQEGFFLLCQQCNLLIAFAFSVYPNILTLSSCCGIIFADWPRKRIAESIERWYTDFAAVSPGKKGGAYYERFARFYHLHRSRYGRELYQQMAWWMDEPAVKPVWAQKSPVERPTPSHGGFLRCGMHLKAFCSMLSQF